MLWWHMKENPVSCLKLHYILIAYRVSQKVKLQNAVRLLVQDFLSQCFGHENCKISQKGQGLQYLIIISLKSSSLAIEEALQHFCTFERYISDVIPHCLNYMKYYNFEIICVWSRTLLKPVDLQLDTGNLYQVLIHLIDHQVMKIQVIA